MSIKLKGSSDGSVSLDAPADTSPSGTDVSFTLPTADGTAEQVLKTDGSGNLSFADNVSSGRNLVVNGSMQVAQRATSVTGVANNSDEGYQTLDRFALYFANSAGGVCTVSQATDVPSNEGFSSSYKVDITTADTSVDASHMIYVAHKIEAQNVRNSGWNYTSTSSYVTLSFWVKSTKAGTYCVAARANDAGAVYYPFEYTLVANTWTKVTHSFPGNSSLVINNDNGVGLELRWYLVVGTDRDNGTANQWNADAAENAATSNQVNFFDSTSNDFYLTGVQLEVGEKSTSFEHRSFGDELHRCKRYYEKKTTTVEGLFATGQALSSTNVRGVYYWEVEKRATPDVVFTGLPKVRNATGNSSGTGTISVHEETIYYVNMTIVAPSSHVTAGNASHMRLQSGTITADSEL